MDIGRVIGHQAPLSPNFDPSNNWGSEACVFGIYGFLDLMSKKEVKEVDQVDFRLSTGNARFWGPFIPFTLKSVHQFNESIFSHFFPNQGETKHGSLSNVLLQYNIRDQKLANNRLLPTFLQLPLRIHRNFIPNL